MRRRTKRLTIAAASAAVVLVLFVGGIVAKENWVHAGPGGIFQQGATHVVREYQQENDAELRERVVDVLMEMDTLPEGIDREMVARFVSHQRTTLDWQTAQDAYDAQLTFWDYDVNIRNLNARMYGYMCEGLERRCEWWVVAFVPFTMYISDNYPRVLAVKPQPDRAFIAFDEETLDIYQPQVQGLDGKALVNAPSIRTNGK